MVAQICNFGYFQKFSQGGQLFASADRELLHTVKRRLILWCFEDCIQVRRKLRLGSLRLCAIFT